MNYQMAGWLMVQLAADVTKLRSDMDEAKKVVGEAAEGMKNALEVVGIGLGIEALREYAKAAIEAGDKMNDMAQKVGMSVPALSAMSVAFMQGGVDADALKTGLVKMSTSVVENADVYKALGIEVQGAGGKIRPIKDILGDVSDIFRYMPDGIEKTRLSTLIFSKSGADMIPMLNEGAEGLRRMSDEAAAMGATMSTEAARAADEFKDALEVLNAKGVAMRLEFLAPALPALTEFVKALSGAGQATHDAGEQSSFFRDAFKTAMEAVAVLGLNVAYTFKALGGEIGTIAAQLAQVAQGNFKIAGEIGDEWTAKAAEMRSEVDRQSAAILNAGDKQKQYADALKLGADAAALSAGETRRLAQFVNDDALAKANAALHAKELAAAQKAAADEARKHAEETKRLVDAGQAYITKLGDEIAAMDDNLRLGRELTQGEKDYLRALNDVRDGKVRMSDQDLEDVRLMGLMKDARAEEIHQRKEEAKLIDEAYNERLKAADAEFKAADSIAQLTEKQREENDALRYSKEQLEQLNLARLDAAIATAQQTVASEELTLACTPETEAHKATLQALLELKEAREQGVILQAAKDAADAWQKTADEIGKGLTDSLFRAFESGKNFFSTFWDGIKNLFKTTVLKLLIQPVQGAMNGLFGSVLGGSGGGSTGGGLMNMLSSGASVMDVLGKGWSGVQNMFGVGPDSMVGGIGRGINSFGNMIGSDGLSNFGAGMYGNAGVIGGDAMSLGSMAGTALSSAGGFMAGHAIGGAIGNGYSAIGGQSGNTAVNVGAATGMIWGPLGSALGGAIGGLVNRAFGMGAKTAQDYGVSGTVSGGDVTAQNYANWKQKGGWFRSNKSGTDYSALTDDQGQMLKSAASSVYAQTKAWAETLKLPADELKKVNYALKIQFSSDEKANIAAINTAFAGYQDALAGQFRDALAPFQKAGETLVETMNRLSAITSFSESLNQFGGVFSKVAQLSIKAKEELIGFAGGMEAFIAKTQDYVSAYYTDSEKVGMQAKQVEQLLASIGVDGAGLSSKADFRKLVESQNIDTTEGRKMLNDLLSVAPAFAQLGDYMEKNGGTLGSLAGGAPQTALLENLLSDQQVQAEYQQKQADSLAALQSTLDRVNGSLNSGFNAVVGSINDRIAALQAAIQDALQNNARTIRDGYLEAQP